MKKDFCLMVRYKILISVLLALFLVLFPLAQDTYAVGPEESDLVDSGIDYRDGIEKAATKDPNTGKTVYVDSLHMNPYRGIHTWAADLVLKNSDDAGVNKAVEPYLSAIMKERSLGYLAVDISDFSGAYHLTDDGGRGPDAELTESALAAIDQTLKNFKKNNMQAIIRFVYDNENNSILPREGWINENGKSVVEARQSMIRIHIGQIAEVLNVNADTILTVQIGFYGHYGELHGSPMCHKNNFKDALKTMLEATRGSGLRVSMRTPSKLAYYLDYDISKSDELDAFVQTVTEEGEDAYRAALFNDGYLGSDSDLGTYYNREKETGWMATQNLHNPYGGDLVPNPNTGEATVEARQPKVLQEMAKVRTSYIAPDSRVQSYWEDVTYDGSLYDDDYARNDPEYKDQSLWTYIENHLGYRFVLRESMLSESVKKGGTLKSRFKVENVGFGNLFYPMKSYAYITDEQGKVVAGPTQVDVDPTSFRINTVKDCSIDLDLPEDIEPGEYKLYLQFKVGDRTVDEEEKPYGAIRLANKGIWSEKLEANYLGSFTVDRYVKITKKWAGESDVDTRPDSLTFTVEKVPEEYQRVEYIEADGTQYIDTGVKAEAAHTIYSDGYSHDADANHLLQVYESNDSRLGAKMYGKSGKIQYHWCIGGEGQSSLTINYADLDGIDIRERLKMTQNASGLQIDQGENSKTIEYEGVTTGTLDSTWKIFYYNNVSSDVPRGFLCEAKILKGDTLLHHYVPCYRKSDEEIGVYDLIDKRFLTNAGTGTFVKGDDIEDGVIVEDTDPEEITVPKDDWTIDGDTWETDVVVSIPKGEMSIFENDIPYYESDATAENKKTIGDNDSVKITNTLNQQPDPDPKPDPQPKPDPEPDPTPDPVPQHDSVPTPQPKPAPGSDPNQKGEDGTAVGRGASAAAAEKAITSSTSDEGPAGSKYALLALRSKSQSKKNIKLSWNRVDGASTYVVYGNECGSKNKMKKLATTQGTAYKVTKISTALKKGKYHKFMVVALDKNNIVISTSKVVHVATKGGKFKNPTGIKLKKTKSIKVKKKVKLGTAQKGKKVKNHRRICYESTNTSIATVSSKGIVTGKKKGSCYIYIYAQNGIYKRVKIKVK